MVLVALAWALPSFLLHNVIHEGAHALVALAAGCRDVRLWPFPGRKLGYWTWAHMTYETGSASFGTLRWLSVAPVFAELAWLVGFGTLLFVAPVGWWTGFLLVEPVSSLVDLTVWMLGFWREPPNPHSDAEVWRNDFRVTRRAARFGSLLLLLPMLVVGWGLVRVF